MLIGIKRKEDPKKKKPIDWSAYPVVPNDELYLTTTAAARIAELFELEAQKANLMRVGVRGGGCSGLTYFFDLVDAAKDSDKVFTTSKAGICVDPKSLKVLGGSIVEYRTELMKSGFEILNPKQKKSCSCGKSFSV